MLGSNPSAGLGTKTEMGRLDGVPFPRKSDSRDWYQSGKSQGFGDRVPMMFRSNKVQ
jgi:hypothetical protein